MKNQSKNNSLQKEAIFVPLGLALLLIIVHLIDLPGCYGVIPRYKIGIQGILLAPLFHSTWEHLFNNIFPLLVLGFMVFSFYKKVAYLLLSMGWLLTGTLVWLFADTGILPSDNHVGCHIGASGIVYMLAFFIFASGVLRKSLPLIAVSLVVVFLYGGMLWGIFPEEVIVYTTEQENISWESHFFGALVGVFFAFVWRKFGTQKKKFSWQNKDHYNVEDEELWQRYLDKYPEEEPKPKPKKPRFKDLF